MTVDLRSFSHPASRLRERAEWRLARAERALAIAQTALDEAQVGVDLAAAMIDATVRAMSAEQLRGQGGQVHALYANRVVQLLAERKVCETARDQQREARDERERRCIELRQEIRGLEHVHARALESYAAGQTQLHWRALDDQVMTRAQWLAARAGREGDDANR